MSTNTANLTNYHPKNPSRTIDDYRDILHKDRPLAPNPMSLDNRAAQFAPYAALTGHRDIITINENSARTKFKLDHDITIIPENVIDNFDGYSLYQKNHDPTDTD